MKNTVDLGRCSETLRNLQISSYPTKAEFSIALLFIQNISLSRSVWENLDFGRTLVVFRSFFTSFLLRESGLVRGLGSYVNNQLSGY